MGTVTHSRAPFESGELPVVSRAGIRTKRLRSTSLMGATYATSGDTVTLPTAPAGYTLDEVKITSAIGLPAGFILTWDGNKTTPKIIAYDPATGTHAQLANASAALAAVVLYLEFVYVSGL